MIRSLMQQRRSGFSLIELLLVIFIISIVYFLGFSTMEKPSEKKKALSPLTLKRTIMQKASSTELGTLICLAPCKSCFFRPRLSAPFKPYEGNVDLAELEAYTIDSEENLQQLEFGRYDDKKLCLRLNFYPNGSTTPIILKTKKGVFFLPAYFGEPQQTETIEEAQDLWLAHAHDLDHEGEFY